MMSLDYPTFLKHYKLIISLLYLLYSLAIRLNIQNSEPVFLDTEKMFENFLMSFEL